MYWVLFATLHILHIYPCITTGWYLIPLSNLLLWMLINFIWFGQVVFVFYCFGHPAYITNRSLYWAKVVSRNMTVFFIEWRCGPLQWNPLHYKFRQIYYQFYVGSITNTPRTMEVITINTIYICILTEFIPFYRWYHPIYIFYYFSPIKL